MKKDLNDDKRGFALATAVEELESVALCLGTAWEKVSKLHDEISEDSVKLESFCSENCQSLSKDRFKVKKYNRFYDILWGLDEEYKSYLFEELGEHFNTQAQDLVDDAYMKYLAITGEYTRNNLLTFSIITDCDQEKKLQSLFKMDSLGNYFDELDKENQSYDFVREWSYCEAASCV